MYAALCQTWQMNYVKIQIRYIMLNDTVLWLHASLALHSQSTTSFFCMWGVESEM